MDSSLCGDATPEKHKTTYFICYIYYVSSKFQKKLH